MGDSLRNDERFKPRRGKRIYCWLSVKLNRRMNVVFMRYRGHPIPLDMNEAKRLRDWLDGVIG